MHKTKNELYESIKDLKTKKEFEEEIKKRFQDYDELIDEDTIALFIVDELGRNRQVVSKIADIKPGCDYTVVGTVCNIYDTKTFKRKNGTSGKVINLDISDGTGTCRLVLWGNDVELIDNKNIKMGTRLKIINGYTKNGYSGIEINVGRWGLLEVEPTDQFDSNKMHLVNSYNVEGILIQKEPTKAFFKLNGEVGFVTTVTIKENHEEKKITVWDKKVKEIQKFNIGEKLVIKDVTRKQNNDNEEIHADTTSTIQRC